MTRPSCPGVSVLGDSAAQLRWSLSLGLGGCAALWGECGVVRTLLGKVTMLGICGKTLRKKNFLNKLVSSPEFLICLLFVLPTCGSFVSPQVSSVLPQPPWVLQWRALAAVSGWPLAQGWCFLELCTHRLSCWLSFCVRFLFVFYVFFFLINPLPGSLLFPGSVRIQVPLFVLLLRAELWKMV